MTQAYFGHEEPSHSGTVFGLPYHSLGANNVKVKMAPFMNVAPTGTGAFNVQSKSPGSVRKPASQHFKRSYAPHVSTVSPSSSYSPTRNSLPMSKSTSNTAACQANQKHFFRGDFYPAWLIVSFGIISNISIIETLDESTKSECEVSSEATSRPTGMSRCTCS